MPVDWQNYSGDDGEPEELRQYHGQKKTCSMCERHFRPGDMVLVDERRDLLFCAPDPEISPTRAQACMIRWVVENARSVVGSLMTFVGKS